MNNIEVMNATSEDDSRDWKEMKTPHVNASPKDDDMAHGANLGHLKQMMSYKTTGQTYLDFGEFCI